MATAMEKSELGKASGFYDENSNTCQPCSVERKNLPADRFCMDCQEYLCTKCSKYHKALKATRDHVLTTAEKANKAPRATTKDKCSLKCTVHKDKAVKYFCVAHSFLGCSVCITMKHKRCENVDYVPTVADDLRNNDDFKELKTLEAAYKATIADLEKNLKHIEADERQLKEAIEEFRKQMNAALDNLDHELTVKAKGIKQEETRKLTDLTKKLAKSKADVDTLMNKVNSLLSCGKNCDTYVLMKQEANKLVSLNEQLVTMTRGTTYQRYELQRNNDLLNAGNFGKLNSRTETVSYSSAVPQLISHTDGPSRVKASPCIDGPTMAKLLQKGTRVRRGKDWQWRYCNQDGGGLGTVEGPHPHLPGRYLVKWDNGHSNSYRMGADNAYDLQIAFNCHGWSS